MNDACEYTRCVTEMYRDIMLKCVAANCTLHVLICLLISNNLPTYVLAQDNKVSYVGTGWRSGVQQSQFADTNFIVSFIK